MMNSQFLTRRLLAFLRLVSERPGMAFIINAGIAAGCFVSWFRIALKGAFWGADFTSYYTAWTMVRGGQGSLLYDYGLQAQVQQSILEGRSFRGGLLPFNYPPHFGLLFSPLSALPLSLSFYLWSAVQLFLLVCLVRLLWVEVAASGTEEKGMLVAVVLALPMLFDSFLLGALPVFGALVLLSFARALRRGAAIEAGLLLVAGSIKPQYVIVPFFVLVAMRQWKSLLAAFTGMAGVVILTAAALGWKSWLDFTRTISVTTSAFGTLGVFPETMSNFKGALSLLFGHGSSHMVNTLSWVALVVVTGTVFFACWKIDPQEDPRIEARLALLLLAGIVFSPHLNYHDVFLAVVPAFLLFAHYRKEPSSIGTLLRGAYFLPLLLFLSKFVAPDKVGVLAPFLVMILLLGLTAFEFSRSKRSA